MTEMDHLIAFKARMMDPLEGRKQLEGGAKVGEADVLMAVYGIPDTGVPVGVGRRQIIDQGAMRTAIDELGSKHALPFVLDHADAHIRGFPDSTKVIGRAENLREEQDGALFRGLWNLETQIGRESFSNAVFNPVGTPYSFRWMEDKVRAGSDGFEHVTEFHGLREVSQLSVSAAQRATGILVDTVNMRVDTPEARTALLDEIQKWVGEDEEWAAKLRDVLKVEVPPPAEITPQSALDGLLVDDMKAGVLDVLRGDKDKRALLRELIEQADQPVIDPAQAAVKEFYENVWASRS